MQPIIDTARHGGPGVQAAPVADALLAIGHSHLRCVQDAATESAERLDAFNFWDDGSLLDNATGEPVLAMHLQARVRDHRGIVFSCIGGGAHTVIALASHPRRYDFVLPGAPELPLDPRAEILPAEAVQAVLKSQTTPYLELMRHLRSLAPGRMVHMESPPPCPDGDRIAPHIPWGLFPGMLQEVAPRHLRYKAWRLHSRLVSEFCREHGIEFMACPQESMDPEGFLRDAYFHDGVHANAAYGALQLRKMRGAA